MRLGITIACSLLLASCDSGFFLKDPTYSQPDSSSAFAAFKEALNADWVKQPYDLLALPKPGRMNYMLAQDNDRKKLENRAAPRVLKALKDLEIGECIWQRPAMKKLPEHVVKRLNTLPDAVYHCTFTIHYEFTGLLGKKYEVPQKGDFFLRDGAVSYLGKFVYPDSPKLKERRVER